MIGAQPRSSSSGLFWIAVSKTRAKPLDGNLRRQGGLKFAGHVSELMPENGDLVCLRLDLVAAMLAAMSIDSSVFLPLRREARRANRRSARPRRPVGPQA